MKERDTRAEVKFRGNHLAFKEKCKQAGMTMTDALNALVDAVNEGAIILQGPVKLKPKAMMLAIAKARANDGER